MWIGFAYQLSFERDYALKRQEAENDNLARLFEEHVRRTLASASIALKYLDDETRRHGKRLDLVQYLRDRRDELAPYSSLSVIDENGDVLLSTFPIASTVNLRNVDNFQTHARDASPDIFASKPRIGTVSGSQTVYLSRRINKADGSFGGYTVAGMDARYFSRFYDQIDLGTNSVVVLLGRDGVIRARRSNAPSSEGKTGQDMSSAALLSVYLPQAERGKFRTTSPIDGIERLYSYRSVEAYPLVVLVGASEAATLAKFEERKEIYLWSGGVASVVILAFAALVLIQMSRGARVAEELRASVERHALVERGTNDGIWDRNLQSGEAYLSPRGKEILGYRKDELQIEETSFFERIHPDEKAIVAEALARSVQDGIPYRIEYRMRHKDGGYRWVLSRGEVVSNRKGEPARMVGSVTDITERKNSERQVQEQARVLDLIFRHSLDGIVLLDKDYNFIRVSESYAKFCQREVSAFRGHKHFELYPSDFEQELEPFRREKKIYNRIARPFIFPDHPEWGTTYWDLGFVPILDQHGEIEFFLFTLKDASARVRAEEKTVDYITRIRALSGRIVAVQEEERRAVACELHDEIGQGLTAVKIHLQAMALACKGCEMAFPTENLDEALLTVAKILEQVRGLSLDLRPMQLDDLGLTVALSSLVARDAATVGWIAHFDEDLSSERLDPNVELACYRVAQEALTNVMRHAGATEVWITLRRSDQTLLLTVRDNGSGFDLASARSAIGTPHLGLLGMEERVRNMGGQFEIRTRGGEGTEVRASFPIATAVAGTAALA